MRLKSYFAESVEAALDQARKELGPEAMLVYSREALPEARYLGLYEVVMALPDAKAAEPPPAGPEQAPALKPSPAAADPQLERLVREVAWLKGQIERMAAASARPPAAAGPNLPSEFAETFSRLRQAGLDEELVDTLAGRLQAGRDLAAPLAADRRAAEAVIRAELGKMFSCDANVGNKEGPARVVALVGPPGSGKTTAAVKLAVACGLARRRPVKLISADIWRVGGADQLRTYAAILGVPFEAVETPGALELALADLRAGQLVLIDTAGLGSRDLDAMADLAALLEARPGVDVHLTLSASMKPADLKRAVARFERFRPAKLLFTHVDETASPVTIVNEAARTAKPLSFLSNGQQIPEDLVEAQPDRILDLILAGADEDISREEFGCRAAAA